MSNVQFPPMTNRDLTTISSGRQKLQSGFTMLELLIYLAIVSVSTGLLAGAFVSISRGQAQAEIRNEVQSNVRFALDKIAQDVRKASAVATPATNGATGAVLDMTVSSVQVSYCVFGGQLRRSSGGACTGSSPVITTPAVNVSSISFTRIGNTNTVLSKTFTGIKVDIAVGYNSTGPDKQFSASKSVTVMMR